MLLPVDKIKLNENIKIGTMFGPRLKFCMQERHANNKRYFEEQAHTTEKYVIPYISAIKPVSADLRVLEIGCGEGGNLGPFLNLGCEVVGVDIVQSRIDKARFYYQDHPNQNNLKLICDDIYNRTDSDGLFDIIIMRDVIEHIHNQEKFMSFVKRFMRSDAVFFLAFPPWYNPFGGHQQICKGKMLSKLPFYHILPTFLYRNILKFGGESQKTIEDLIEIKQTGITIERFEKIVRTEGFQIKSRTWYFINPNYETKFGLKPRIQSSILTAFPFFRNFFVTAAYYLISKEK
jgi:SAM-dependent methyltransferase